MAEGGRSTGCRHVFQAPFNSLASRRQPLFELSMAGPHAAPSGSMDAPANGAAAPTAPFSPGQQLKAGEYTLGKLLHQGPRSRVYEATRTSDGARVAVKVLDASSARQWRAALHEADMMRRCTAAACKRQRGPQGGGTAAAAAAAAAPGTPAAAAGASSGLLVGLLEWWLADMPAEGDASASTARGDGSGGAAASLSTQQPSASPGAAAAAADASAGPGEAQPPGACYVCLALEGAHQPASAVLRYLRRRGRDGRGLPLPAVRRMGRCLLAALDELHSGAGVVHRDVKPSNLLLGAPFLVTRPPGEARAVRGRQPRRQPHRSMSLGEICAAPWLLADFGSACPLVKRWPWSKPEAAVPLAYDSPPYAPPEVVLGLPSGASHDLWSAGCALYEAATGRRLFDVPAAPLPRAHGRGLRLGGGGPGAGASSDSSWEGEESSSSGGGETTWRRLQGDGPGNVGAAPGTSPYPGDFAADEAHLWQIKQLLGQPPLRVLDRSPWADHWYDPRGLLRADRRLPLRPVPLRERLARDAPHLTPEEAEPLAAFLSELLVFDPDARPSAGQALRHPWLALPPGEEHDSKP